MYKNITGIIFVLILASSCKVAAKNGIPEKMPADFAIDYSSTGGMMAIYRTTHLQTGACSDAGKDKDGAFAYTFSVRGESMQELYSSLRQLNAFTMKAEVRGRVYDRGGVKITYTLNQTTYVVDNSESSFILQEYEQGFKSATELIKTFADKHRNEK